MRRVEPPHRVEDHVEAFVAELGRELFAEHDLVIAEPGRVVGSGRTADDADDPVGPGKPGELGGEGAYRAGRGMDQHAFAGPYSSRGVDQVVGGRCGPAEPPGRPQWQVADVQTEDGGRHDHLGAGARSGQCGHGCTDAVMVDALADRGDVPGRLESGDEGARGGEVAVPEHGVPPLDSGVGDLDRHLAGAGSGLIEFGDLVVAIGVEKDSLHEYSSLR